MNERKGLVTRVGEAMDVYLAERQQPEAGAVASSGRNWPRWLARQMVPNIGTILVVAALLFTVPSLAQQVGIQAPSTSTISYQGRLADSTGNPLTGVYNMEFRIYEDPVTTAYLWEEFWTGGNAVEVSDGLFNVMLGSINASLASVIQGHDELYLGITVGADSEMVPRVQLGSVPFSMHALTVPDGSIATAKLANDAVTSDKIATGAVGSDEVADNSLSAADLAIDSVGSSEVAAGAVGSSEVADNSLTATDLAVGSVGSSEVADNSLTNSDLGAGSVRSSEVYNDSLTADDLAAGSVGSSEIASGAVKAAELDVTAFNDLTVRTFSFPLECRNDYGNGHAGCERHYNFSTAFPNKTLYVVASIHLAGNSTYWHWVPAAVYNVTKSGFDLGFVTYTDAGSVGWYNQWNTTVEGWAVGY